MALLINTLIVNLLVGFHKLLISFSGEFQQGKQGPLLLIGINSIPNINIDYIHHLVWDEITYQFP